MGPVFVHGQQVPDIAVEIAVQVLNQRGGRVDNGLTVPHPDQALDALETAGSAVLEGVEQLHHRQRAFALADKVNRLFLQRLFGQGRDMAADHDDRDVLVVLLDRPALFAGARHLLRRGRRLVPEDDHPDQSGIGDLDPFGDGGGVQVLRLAIHDGDGKTMVAGVSPDQAAPQRRLHRRQMSAQFLVNFMAATRIDQQQVQGGFFRGFSHPLQS